MGKLKKDFKFKVIKNFLDDNERRLIKNYCASYHINNQNNFDIAQNSNGDTSKYSDPLMESLLICKISKVEEESNLKLLPTYSFWRMYTKFADLKPHKDRPSCECSVTVQIASDGTKWPIYIDGEEIILEDGDAALYWGTEVEHSRKEFLGDYQSQVFLHYVDADGPFKEYVFDKRIHTGIDLDKNIGIIVK
jgi:hypothetical protein